MTSGEEMIYDRLSDEKMYSGDPLRLSNGEFRELSRFISSRWGIQLPPSKKDLLEGRLRNRIRTLRMPSFRDYCQYLFSPQGMEREPMEMIDVITTNKTDFFREADHFAYLSNNALVELTESGIGRTTLPLTVWSAGCSSGEEPWTLAMVISSFAASRPDLRFNIVASDISSRVLQKARHAVYTESQIEPVPLPCRRSFLLKSRDASKRLVRIHPALRRLVEFKRVNLLESGVELKMKFHVIFCRNVIIYFSKSIQDRVLQELFDHLHPGGFLFLGHSEAMPGLKIPLTPVAPTVYRKAGEL